MTNTNPLDTLGERIEQIIEEKKLNQNSFALLVGSNRQNINRVLNKDTVPSYMLINQILLALPSLNAEWLTRGIGPIWKDEGIEQATLAPKSNGDLEKKKKGWEDMTIREVGELLERLKGE